MYHICEACKNELRKIIGYDVMRKRNNQQTCCRTCAKFNPLSQLCAKVIREDLKTLDEADKATTTYKILGIQI